jgi:hypothetical protein
MGKLFSHGKVFPYSFPWEGKKQYFPWEHLKKNVYIKTSKLTC